MFYWLARWVPILRIIFLSAKFKLDCCRSFFMTQQIRQAFQTELFISSVGIQPSYHSVTKQITTSKKAIKHYCWAPFHWVLKSSHTARWHLHRFSFCCKSSALFSPRRTRKDRFIRFGTMTHRVFVQRRTMWHLKVWGALACGMATSWTTAMSLSPGSRPRWCGMLS